MAVRRIVCLEGNIGAGKSSILTELQRKGYTVAKEPVEQWCSESGLLGMFYKNPARYAYPFQNQVMQSLFERDASYRDSQGPILSERSAGSGLTVFSEYARKQKWIDSSQFALLENRYKNIQKSERGIRRQVIYLRMDSGTAYERMRARDRPEEANVSKEYLQEIHALHEEQCQKAFPFGSELLGIADAAMSLDHVVSSVCQLLMKHL